MFIQLLLFFYILFILYKVSFKNMDITDKDTWALKNEMLVIPIPDENLDGECILYIDDDNAMNKRGELVNYTRTVPCSECNQYVYRKNGDCILYKHEPSEIVGKCVINNDMKPKKCYFDQNSSAKSIFSTLSSIFE